jgi:hypothetical protein
MIRWMSLTGYAIMIFLFVICARQTSLKHSNCWIGWHKWLYIDKRHGGKWCPLCGKVKYAKKGRITPVGKP